MGSRRPHQYSGELSVGTADGGAQVTVRLHTEDVDGQQVDDGLRETLEQIKKNVEGGS